ncbi:MAG: hypothetical protein OQJ84_01990 [Xanthomonadales bacterium]|nr:hypothetical protein [Xanthomonadales bacterium]
MRTILLCFLSLYLLAGAIPALAEPESEIDLLRAELKQMRADYEARIADLERRLDTAEQTAAVPQTTTVQAPGTATATADAYQPAPSIGQPAMTGGGAFNPDIGVILQGMAWSYDHDPEEYQIPGFPLSGHAELAPEGLSLGEAEINISANVDDKFTAWLTVPIHVHEGDTEVEIEEAWIETLALPAGLSLRMGRFMSNIGYLNSKHPHSWDFADQALPYQAFLGTHYLDDGLQLRWLAPTDTYLELGGELLRGDHYLGGGEGDSGVGAYSLTARTGGDVGFDHSWQAGLSYLHVDAENRPLGGHAHADEHEEDHDGDEDHEGDEGHEDGPLMFGGDTGLWIADFVWKWAPNGNWKQRNFVFQAEYLLRNEDGFYTMPDADVLPWDVNQSGWYVQAVYQPFPRWRFGMRYDRLSSDNPGAAFADSILMPGSDDPQRYSFMTDWSNSEFSRLRLQYTLDKTSHEDDNQWGLQYIFSIGAHGAHSF